MIPTDDTLITEATLGFDADHERDARWLADHADAPALELPHPEQSAYDALVFAGDVVEVREAAAVFGRCLAAITTDLEDGSDVPY